MDDLEPMDEKRDPIIEHATVLIADRDGITPMQAFEHLRAESQSTGRNLRDLALEQVDVATRRQGDPDHSGPVRPLERH